MANFYGFADPNFMNTNKKFGPAMWQMLQNTMGPAQGGPVAAGVSDEAVKQWYGGNNPPSWAEMVSGGSPDSMRRAMLTGGQLGGDIAGTRATQGIRDTGAKDVLGLNNAFAENIFNNTATGMRQAATKNAGTSADIGMIGSAMKPFLGQGGLLMGQGNAGFLPNLLTGPQGAGGKGFDIFNNLGSGSGLMGMLSGMFGGGGGSMMDLFGGLGGATAAGGDAELMAQLAAMGMMA